MPDIRDVLKGLSADEKAIYAEVRTTMRRAYLYAHSKVLPIEKYDEHDDSFLDLIDIKIALLFDRAGTFDHSQGNLNIEAGKAVENLLQSQASKMITNSGWSTKQ